MSDDDTIQDGLRRDLSRAVAEAMRQACAYSAAAAALDTANAERDAALGRAEKVEALNRDLALDIVTLRKERNRAAQHADIGTWMWSDTDPNDLASMADGSLITMTAGQLRALTAERDAALGEGEQVREEMSDE